MRFVFAAILIAASQALVWGMSHRFSSRAPQLPRRELAAFANKLGPWTGKEIPLDKRLFAATGSARMINRAYRNAAGEEVSANIGLWTNYEIAIPHNPELCYGGAGWVLVERRDIPIETTGQPAFSARLLSFDRHGERIKVLFWVQLGEDVCLSDPDIRRVWQKSRLAGAARPVAMKVMLQTSAQDPSQAAARLGRMANLAAAEARLYR